MSDNYKIAYLPGKESLNEPGIQDREIKVIRDGQSTAIYEWRANQRSWKKLSEVMVATSTAASPSSTSASAPAAVSASVASLSCVPMIGLVNTGSTCFLNSVLQVLVHTVPLMDYVLGHDSGRCQANCAVCLMKNHIFFAKERREPWIPWPVIRGIKGYMHSYNGGQSDAQEFLRCFVDSMQANAVIECEGKSNDLSAIHNIFGIEFKNEVVCNRCRNASVTHVRELDWSVPIDESIMSLEIALTRFTSLETLDGDSAYSCPVCRRRVSAQKTCTVFREPNVCTMQLKRVQLRGDRQVKLKHLISYPKRLNLRPFMSDREENQSPIYYQLYGIICHYGDTPTCGHYFSYVRNRNDQWYLLDDQMVATKVTALNLSDAYVLFYIREEAAVPRGSLAVGQRASGTGFRSLDESEREEEKLIEDERRQKVEDEERKREHRRKRDMEEKLRRESEDRKLRMFEELEKKKKLKQQVKEKRRLLEQDERADSLRRKNELESKMRTLILKADDEQLTELTDAEFELYFNVLSPEEAEELKQKRGEAIENKRRLEEKNRFLTPEENEFCSSAKVKLTLGQLEKLTLKQLDVDNSSSPLDKPELRIEDFSRREQILAASAKQLCLMKQDEFEEYFQYLSLTEILGFQERRNLFLKKRSGKETKKNRSTDEKWENVKRRFRESGQESISKRLDDALDEDFEHFTKYDQGLLAKNVKAIPTKSWPGPKLNFAYVATIFIDGHPFVSGQGISKNEARDKAVEHAIQKIFSS